MIVECSDEEGNSKGEKGGEMTRNEALTLYPDLTRYDATFSLDEANKNRTACRSSGVYVHYCHTDMLEPFVIAAGGTKACLDQAHSIRNAGHQWTCVYVGECAESKKGRVFARRLYFEIGMGGYLRQAPAIEALCSLIFRKQKWIPYHTNPGKPPSKLRVYLEPEHREKFEAWCKAHVRVAYRKLDLPLATAKATVRTEERNLITGLSPLLNIKLGTNDFKLFSPTLRSDLRRDSLKVCHPKPLHAGRSQEARQRLLALSALGNLVPRTVKGHIQKQRNAPKASRPTRDQLQRMAEENGTSELVAAVRDDLSAFLQEERSRAVHGSFAYTAKTPKHERLLGLAINNKSGEVPHGVLRVWIRVPELAEVSGVPANAIEMTMREFEIAPSPKQTDADEDVNLDIRTQEAGHRFARLMRSLISPVTG
jgi:hypothetical protein